MIRLLLTSALIFGVLSIATTASATCGENCTLRLAHFDCTSPADGVSPGDRALFVTGSCVTTCCAPPMEGSDSGTCDSWDPVLPVGGLRVSSMDAPVEVEFEEMADGCDGGLVRVSSLLGPGDYSFSMELEFGGSQHIGDVTIEERRPDGILPEDVDTSSSGSCSAAGGVLPSALSLVLAVGALLLSRRRR